jgi:phosphatidylinositol kinase/protein kinase (PI-3  family)
LAAIEGLHAFDPASPRSVWKPFQHILQDICLQSLQQRCYRLADISPFLASLNGSSIAMPGFEAASSMTVATCNETIYVLPTKTKPKRIEFTSSDGSTYFFLLKGHEDLHLDERIQQFLNNANILLKSDKLSLTRRLMCRTYQVVPFGHNYGMIQWISNATGIFSIYRKYLHWQHTTNLLKQKDEQATNPQLIRPNENFQELLQDAFKAGKLQKKLPRKEWPVEVMEEIFLKLKNDTPTNIISKELWTSSLTAMDWWEKTNTLSRSVAVMVFASNRSLSLDTCLAWVIVTWTM